MANGSEGNKMSDKYYITFHVEKSDGSEIKIKNVIHKDVPYIDNLFDSFLDFLRNMTYPKQLIKAKLAEYADKYQEDEE